MITIIVFCIIILLTLIPKESEAQAYDPYFISLATPPDTVFMKRNTDSLFQRITGVLTFVGRTNPIRLTPWPLLVAVPAILADTTALANNVASITPQSRTLTINGNTQSLAANRTWNLTSTDIPEGANLYYTAARFNTAFSGKSTSDLTEGSNLYYTAARFNTAFSGKSTSDLTEGSNLYYTSSRFNTAFGTKTTTDLAEGTNLYWTNARGDARYPQLSGSYSNPSWITALAQSKITYTGTTAQYIRGDGSLATTPLGSVTSIATTSPITGGTITGSGTIGINNAAADNSTKGAASFDAPYFDDNGSGIISFAVASGTGTISASAVTINQPRGKITYNSPNIIAAGTATFTLTNSFVNSTSTINVGINGNGSNLISVNCYIKSQTSGSCVIAIQNLSLLNLFNTNMIIDFLVVN